MPVEDDRTGRVSFEERPGSEHLWRADLVLLAIGYVGPERDGVVAALDLELDQRGNVKTDEHYMTSRPGVFAAGDMRRGQSLVVWAIAEGRGAARGVDAWLRGGSDGASDEGGDGSSPGTLRERGVLFVHPWVLSECEGVRSLWTSPARPCVPMDPVRVCGRSRPLAQAACRPPAFHRGCSLKHGICCLHHGVFFIFPHHVAPVCARGSRSLWPRFSVQLGAGGSMPWACAFPGLATWSGRVCPIFLGYTFDRSRASLPGCSRTIRQGTRP